MAQRGFALDHSTQRSLHQLTQLLRLSHHEIDAFATRRFAQRDQESHRSARSRTALREALRKES